MCVVVALVRRHHVPRWCICEALHMLAHRAVPHRAAEVAARVHAALHVLLTILAPPGTREGTRGHGQRQPVREV